MIPERQGGGGAGSRISGNYWVWLCEAKQAVVPCVSQAGLLMRLHSAGGMRFMP